MPKETGLMFKGPLVRAILEGRKTQTRRIVKGVGHDNCIQVRQPGKTKAGMFSHVMDAPKLGLCPMGKPGDRIYVRETWANGIHALAAEREEDGPFVYAADGDLAVQGRLGERWKPAIHMPKYAARIWLEITGVRVERLQQISDADALAEGVDRTNSSIPGYARERFQQLWDSTTGRPTPPANKNSKRYARVKHWLDTHPDTTGWDANPWVWVIDFKPIQQLTTA